MMPLNGFRTVLTGATGGIGKAMAFELAGHSQSMLLLGRDSSTLNTLRDAVLNVHPSLHVSCLAGDLTDSAYVAEIAAYSREQGVNLVVNNAGVNQFGSAQQLQPEALRRIMDTNLLAPMLLTQALLPELLKQDQAQLIQVGSIFGYIGYPGNAAYCASKFGLRGYAQALARELADTRVRVKYLAPRATATAINHGAVEQLNQELGVACDMPERVASALMTLVQGDRFDLRIGFPEKLFVFLNQLFPRINDAAIRKQLPTISKHWSVQ